jgi:hypothetical protein
MSGIDGKTLAIAAIIIAIAALGYGMFIPGSAGPEGPAGPQGPQGVHIDEELSERLQIAIEGYVEPKRGCTSCHVLVDEETGKYTLAYEAHERVEVRRGTDSHPSTALDGTDISPTSDAGVETCLQCHAPDPDTGRGVMAPLSLRDIVHPAHMTSQYFKLHYGGNCFTCHNVNAEGEWEVLTEAVSVNEKGVPDPAQIPIPGAIEVHVGT